MYRWLAKLIGLVLAFLLSFIFTVLPHHVERRVGHRGERILCILLCFTGGVFFATYLLHTAPEVRRASHSFLPREAMLSAVYAVVVCLCVCLSHSGIVSKRLNVGSRKQRRTIAPLLTSASRGPSAIAELLVSFISERSDVCLFFSVNLCKIFLKATCDHGVRCI